MGSFHKMKKLLEEKRSFLLVCHIDPDGDAVGSMLAMREHLVSVGDEVSVLCKDPIPNLLHYLEGNESIVSEFPVSLPEAIILLDNGDSRRTGFLLEIMAMKNAGVPVINIDHHPKNDLWKMVSVNYADDKVSSTCEMIFRIFTGLDWEITPTIATKLLTGIYTDTGGFRHPNTTDEVLRIVSELLKKGAKLKKISEQLENSRSVSLFRLWGIALSRLYYNEELSISMTVITQADIIAAKATEEDISGLVNLLNSASESRAAMLLYETKDAKIKGSLRTDNDEVDMAKLAHHLGGGGHRKAAGFTISGHIEIDGDKWRIV
jgi:phosphoesterase RecJ-like protein